MLIHILILVLIKVLIFYNLNHSKVTLELIVMQYSREKIIMTVSASYCKFEHLIILNAPSSLCDDYNLNYHSFVSVLYL